MDFALHEKLTAPDLDSLPVQWYDVLDERKNIVAVYDLLAFIIDNLDQLNSFVLGDVLEGSEDLTKAWGDTGDDTMRGVFEFSEDAIDYGNAIRLQLEVISLYHEEEDPDEEINEKLAAFHVIQKGLRETSTLLIDSEYEVPEMVREFFDVVDTHTIAQVTPFERRLELIHLSDTVVFILRSSDGQTNLPIDQLVLYTEAVKLNKDIYVLELGREDGEYDTQLTNYYEGLFDQDNVTYFTGSEAFQDLVSYLVTDQIPQDEDRDDDLDYTMDEVEAS